MRIRDDIEISWNITNRRLRDVCFWVVRTRIDWWYSRPPIKWQMTLFYWDVHLAIQICIATHQWPPVWQISRPQLLGFVEHRVHAHRIIWYASEKDGELENAEGSPELKEFKQNYKMLERSNFLLLNMWFLLETSPLALYTQSVQTLQKEQKIRKEN